MKRCVLLLICLMLSSCALVRVHKEDVQQGNILKSEDFSSLHLGMTRAQVQEKLGSPVLDNTFAQGGEAYVYSLKPGYGKFQAKQVTLVFKGDRLLEIRQ